MPILRKGIEGRFECKIFCLTFRCCGFMQEELEMTGATSAKRTESHETDLLTKPARCIGVLFNRAQSVCFHSRLHLCSGFAGQAVSSSRVVEVITLHPERTLRKLPG